MGCCGSREDEGESEPLRSGRVYEAPNQNQYSINSLENSAYPPSSSFISSSPSDNTDWDSKAHFEEIIQQTVTSLIDVSQNKLLGISSKEAERRGHIYGEHVFKSLPQAQIFTLPTPSYDSLNSLRAPPVDRSNITLITKTTETISANYKSLHVKDVGPFVVQFSYDPK